MEQCESKLAFHISKWASTWGWGNARPISTGFSSQPCSSLLLVGPPFTVRLRKTVEGLPILQVNFPLVLWTDAGAVIMPPDTEDPLVAGKTIPFYRDPPDRPGLHRDLFAAHSGQLLGKMLLAGFNLSPSLTSCAPPEIQQQVASAASAAAAAASAAATAAAATSEAQELVELGMEVVAAILAERPLPKRRSGSNQMEYLVEWAEYKPEWEADYRQGRGQVGDPFTSWERESTLKRLTLFKEWKAAHSPQPQA